MTSAETILADQESLWEAYMAETPIDLRSPQGALAFAFDKLTSAAATPSPDVRAATIEECIRVKVKLAGGFGGKSDAYLRGFQSGCNAFIDALRALSSPDRLVSHDGSEE